MAGTPADLTEYIDGNVSHDHSYYGNGCPNDWGDGGKGGSITPCSTRILQTYDNESQKNGTFYVFQSATSGTGGAMSTNNTNSPDTFCPLGWQLPYSGKGGDYYDKSKSWWYLYNQYSITFNQGTRASYEQVSSYPLSYILPGFFHWNMGRLYVQGKNGYYWSSTITNVSDAHRMNVWVQGLNVNESNIYKEDAQPLRCV